MPEKLDLYFPAGNAQASDLFGARFPMAAASLTPNGAWQLEQQAVAKGKNPKLGQINLKDDIGNEFSGVPQAGSGTGDQAPQHFALIRDGDKLVAFPVEWFYMFKPKRKNQQSVEDAENARKAAMDRDLHMTKAFNKKFNIKDDVQEESTAGRVKAVSQLDGLHRGGARKAAAGEEVDDLEPELEELFAMDEQRAEGWDYDEDVANNDIEAEVNKEVAVEREEEELAELEQEHMELEKVLKKEGRVDTQKDDDNDLKLDLGEDEEDEELPALAAERRREQQAEKDGAKHMSKLRKRVKHQNLLMTGLVGEDDSDDSMDSNEDDSDDPTTRPSSPHASGGGGSASEAAAGRSAASSRQGADNKRERPADMQESFVAVKRANVPIAQFLAKEKRGSSVEGRRGTAAANGGSAPAQSAAPPAGGAAANGQAEVDISGLTDEQYRQIAASVRLKWPSDPLGQPIAQCRLKDVIDVVKGAFQAALGMKMSKQMIKELLQIATKGGGPTKPAMFKNAGKSPDGKSTFSLAVVL